MIKNNVLPYCNKDQIIIFVHERIKNNTVVEMNKIFDKFNVNNFETDIKTVHSDQRNVRENEFKKWSTDYSNIDQSHKKILNKHYAPYNEKLFNFLGYKITEWNL